MPNTKLKILTNTSLSLNEFKAIKLILSKKFKETNILKASKKSGTGHHEEIIHKINMQYH